MAILFSTYRMYRIKSYGSNFYFPVFDASNDPSQNTPDDITITTLQLNDIQSFLTYMQETVCTFGGELWKEHFMNVSVENSNPVSVMQDTAGQSILKEMVLFGNQIQNFYSITIMQEGQSEWAKFAFPIILKYNDKYYYYMNNATAYPLTQRPTATELKYSSIDTYPRVTSLGKVTIYQDTTSVVFNFGGSSSYDCTSFGIWLEKNNKPINSNDPYQNVGDEPDDPGQGDFDYSSDDVTIPDLPETDVTESGLVSLFAPNDDQLQKLAKFLWSDSFSLDSFKKILNNPMDCILGLSKLPVHLPHGGAKEITVGNIVSTVSCDTCKQYLKLNCGTFTFRRSNFTGGYLDNAPYTRCYLYLPFIGTQEINIDEFMAATMGIEYHIDTLTGAMFCFVTRNDKLILTYAGNCAENVPLSSNDFTSTISSMLSMATIGAGAVATIATAGAAAPTTAGMANEALGARTASSLVGAGAQGASAVMNSKPNVQHSGSLGGGAGAMGQLYPYLIFIAPRPDIPTDQNMYTGFPSNDIVQIGNLTDFNVIEAVNLKVEGANDTEMSEIEAILKGGVII